MAQTKTTFASDAPQTFTLDGRLLNGASGAAAGPLIDSNVTLILSVLDSSKTCVLYEESQNISTVPTDGYFSVEVGSDTAATKRTTADSGHTMTQVFQNKDNLTGKLLSDGVTACNVTAASGSTRYLRTVVQASSISGGAAKTLSPDLAVGSVPTAIIATRAESVQGYTSDQLLKVNTSGSNALTQANLESVFSTPAKATAIAALADGSSTLYVSNSTTVGARLPAVSGTPASATTGSIWYDTADNQLKYRNAGGTTVPLVSGSSSGMWTEASGNVYRATGNVGIGLTSPLDLLHVNGTHRATTGIFGFGTNPVTTFDAPGGGATPLSSSSSTGGGVAARFITGNGRIQIMTWSGGSTGDLEWRTNDGSGTPIQIRGGAESHGFSFRTQNTERMRIATSGNVGIGTATPTELLDVNGGVRLGLTTNTNAGTVRWDGMNFQGYTGSAWVNFVPNPPASGACDTTNSYTVAGAYAYTVPASFGTITIRIWGGGGAGGASGSGGASGNAGGTSSISSLGLFASGGSGGQSSSAGATGGTGGTASGGSINLNGSAGTAASGATGGTGGASPNGGGARPGPTGLVGGFAGNGPGGGGSGAAGNAGFTAGGGGGGAYTEKTFTSASLNPGTYINDIIVGAGGTNSSNGGPGAAGRVDIACASAGSPSTNDRSILFFDGSQHANDTNFVYSADQRLGVGTATPQTKLDVVGEIKVGNSGTACSGITEGAFRWNSATKKPEVCDGTSWRALAFE